MRLVVKPICEPEALKHKRWDRERESWGAGARVAQWAEFVQRRTALELAYLRLKIFSVAPMTSFRTT